MLSVSFYVQRKRLNSSKEAPIIVRLRLNGERRDLSTGISINLKKTEFKTGMVQGRGERVKAVNDLLSAVKNNLLRVYAQIAHQEQPTLDRILTAYNGKEEHRHEPSLMWLLQLHNETLKKRIGLDYSKATLDKYQVLVLRMQQFLKDRHNGKDVKLKSLTRAFAIEFLQYLLTVHRNSHNSATKTLKNLKRVINFGVEREHLEVNPFVSIRLGYKEVDKVILTEVELNAIQSKEFSIQRLDLVKDLFLFQCYTGLSYVDMAVLRHRNVVKASDGILWLEVFRRKTNKKTQIPLFPVAQSIVDKYNSAEGSPPDKPLLPVMANQKLNAYLKEIADICGINKRLTSHCGRRTFASTVLLNNGITIDVVSRMLAHSSIRMTEAYAKVYDQKIVDQTKRIPWLWKK